MKKLMMVASVLGALCAAPCAARAADHEGGTVIELGTVANQYFSGTYEKSVYIVKGSRDWSEVTFENCTFDGVSADANGSCVLINRNDDGVNVRVVFKNCRFINCGNTGKDGGAIYIQNVDNSNQKVVFENCVAIGCKADEGGFLYCNDIDAVVEGSGSTVISGCTAVKGGGVYIDAAKTFDGFILADNTSTKDGGGLYNNTGGDGVSTIQNCRFYRNAAGSGYKGGGLYFDDDNGFLSNCRFLENTAGSSADCYVDDDSTTVSGLITASDFANRSFAGSGTEADPCQIKDADDWDSLYCFVKNKSTDSAGKYYAGKHYVLAGDILVATTIGGFNSNPDLKRPFSGVFDGNGHTITLYSVDGGSDKAAFGCAQGATVRSLTVNGRIEGGYSLGGIFGNGSGSTASNCVNNATIVGTAHYIGGIAGWSGNGAKFIDCVNNGKVEGVNCVGGIAGLSGGNSRFLSCLNRGDVAGADYAGGIVGSEESAVSVENCHEFGSFNFPMNGDFVIYTALDSTMCLDFEGSGMYITDDPQIWTADGSAKQMFTLKYDRSKGGYTIKAKQSGLVLMRDSSTGGLYQYEDCNLESQRWEFIPTDDGYYYIHSLDSSSTEGYLDVTGAKAEKGTKVGTYTFNGNANQKFRLVRTGEHMGGITGHSASGSTYELCVYSKDDSPADAHGIGVSHDALWGDGTETLFEQPEAIEGINDYITDNDKQKDGWLRVAFNRSGQPVFVPNGLTDELGYSVGQISETEYIFWKLGKLYRVTDGVAGNLNYAVVTKDTDSMGSGWYVVEDVVSRTSKMSVWSANLVLLHGASLTVDCSGKDYVAGIEVEDGELFCVFGVESGSLTVQGGYVGAGIGGGMNCSGDKVAIYGGTVKVNGGWGGAGIGGGTRGAGGEVTINGGTVTATGSGGAAGIGGGNGGAGGSLTIGPRVFQVDDNHWEESDAVVAFDPGQFGLQLSSATVDGGRIKQTMVNGAWICALDVGHCLTLSFAPAFLGDRIVGNSTVTVGPILEDIALGVEDLPSVETKTLTVDYIGTSGTPGTVSARLVSAISMPSTMREGWYVVTDEVTIATTVVSGSANLILADGAKLTVNGGIGVDEGNWFGIYGQGTGSGTLTTSGAQGCAGIGGRNPERVNGYGNCGDVRIYGGTVIATGGTWGAGIGGGYGGAGGYVAINGGMVTANGGGSAAGIGGGYYSDNGGRVYIDGGTVEAGGVFGLDGSEVMIYGGSVKASIRNQPKKGSRTNVFCVTCEGLDGLVSLEGLDGYKTRDIYPIDGKIYLYLPDGSYRFKANDNRYVACVDGGGVEAKRFTHLLTVPPVEHATAVVTVDGSVFAGERFDDSMLLETEGSTVSVLYTCDPGYATEDGQATFETVFENVTEDCTVEPPAIVRAQIEVLDAGRYGVASSADSKQYVDTGYTPTANTRIEADFNTMTRSQIWGVFFGVTSNDKADDGILLRYTKYDDMSLNAWFCGSSEQITGFDGKRLSAELRAGSLAIDGTPYPITTTGTPYDGSIYLFCGNNGGTPWRHQAMTLHSFKIYDIVDDVEKLVHDLVPARAKDGRDSVGLYDKMTGEILFNRGGGTLVLEEVEDVAVSVGEGVEKVIYGGQEYTADFSIPDVAPGTVLTFTMVTAGDQYDEDVTAEGDLTGGKVGNDYVYTVASEPSGQNAAIRFNTTVAPAVAYAYEDSKIIFVARCSTFAEAWAYARDGEHYVKIFKDYTGSESSELFALDGTMRVNFNGHTVYATAERGKGFAIETVNSRHRTYTPYDTIAEAYAMGGSQSTYVVLGEANASTITLRPGNLAFEGHFWPGYGNSIIGSIINEPALNKDAEKTETWGVKGMNFSFVATTDAPTPIMPGQSSDAYESREEATAAAASTEILPAEGFDLLGHPEALATWQGYFVNRVFVGGDGKYRFMPELNADGSNAVAAAEAKLTRAIDVGAIAAAGTVGKMVLEGAEPGFYYTLYKSADVTTVLDRGSHDPLNSDRKALSDGKVTFTNVAKPADAVGFFSVRASVREEFTDEGGLGGGGLGDSQTE